MSELDDVIEELEVAEERTALTASRLSKKIIQCKELEAENKELTELLHQREEWLGKKPCQYKKCIQYAELEQQVEEWKKSQRKVK